MLELPEAAVIAEQVNERVVGKTIAAVEAGHSPHKWAWYYGDPADYEPRLKDRRIEGATFWGGLIEIATEDAQLYLGDGVNLRYLEAEAPRPKKHQLLIDFEDGSSLLGSVSMYGGLWVCPAGELPNKYLAIAMEKPSPYDERFTTGYFASLFENASEALSAKAFLATEQRIPGLGNGVLQDILYNAGIHPKRKIASLDADVRMSLYDAVRTTLAAMREAGGRDTERLLFGEPGGYRTLLSRNTVGTPCTRCGAVIEKAAYLGGSVYFCPGCQVEAA